MMADEFDVDALLEAAYVSKSTRLSDFASNCFPRLLQFFKTAVDLSFRIKQVEAQTSIHLLNEADSGSRENGTSSYSNGSRSREVRDDLDRRERDRGDRDRKRSRSPDRDRERKRRSRSKSRERDRKEGNRSRDKERERKRRSRSRDRERERDRDRSGRDRKRSKSKERPRGRRSRSKSKEKEVRRRSRSRSRERKRSRTPPRLRLGPRRRSSRTPTKEDAPLTPEERDARTVFCMQLSQRVRARDLEDFFSSVGKVRDVRMITCNKTRRFKGIAYVEFGEIDSVALALGLNGQKLMGIPIIVQPSQAEKNRAGQVAKSGAIAAALATSNPGPMKLYVGSLHFNITEEMLRGIFEPFGRVDEIILMKDHDTGRSKGFGFITFHEGEDAKRAMEQLNGFEIAGRPMKVGYVTEKSENSYHANPQNYLDTDEMDRAGVNLGVTGRLQLMAKLAEGTDLKLPEAATTALNMQNQLSTNPVPGSAAPASAPTPVSAPPIATQCFMLSNMFDPLKDMETPGFEAELKEEVIDACLDHGGCVHVLVDTSSPQGNVYVKCPTVASAVSAVNSLHGRWFGGRLITAAYVPLLNYHSLFPDAMAAQLVLRPSKKS